VIIGLARFKNFVDIKRLVHKLAYQARLVAATRCKEKSRQQYLLELRAGF
jgi:hypothetical protein